MAEVIDPFAIILSGHSLPGFCTVDDCAFGMHARTIFTLPDTELRMLYPYIAMFDSQVVLEVANGHVGAIVM